MYFYNARYYDPALGRFISADTVVPNPGNPQDLNRYAYVRNNPLKYRDPTGHYIFDEDYPDPTSAYYPVKHAYGSTYLLGPQDAEAILGVSVPQRISQGYVGMLNDPRGLAMPIIGFGAALVGGLAGMPMPQVSTQMHVPSSLLQDAYGDPGFGPDIGQMSPGEVARLKQISEEYDCTFTVCGRRSETQRGLLNRDMAYDKYGLGADAPEYGVPAWRNTGPSSGRNEFDYFVRGGDLPAGAIQELRQLYGLDVEFDNWAKLRGNPYAGRDPGGIVFDRGKVYRNFLEPWQ